MVSRGMAEVGGAGGIGAAQSSGAMESQQYRQHEETFKERALQHEGQFAPVERGWECVHLCWFSGNPQARAGRGYTGP